MITLWNSATESNHIQFDNNSIVKVSQDGTVRGKINKKISSQCDLNVYR